MFGGIILIRWWFQMKKMLWSLNIFQSWTATMQLADSQKLEEEPRGNMGPQAALFSFTIPRTSPQSRSAGCCSCLFNLSNAPKVCLFLFLNHTMIVIQSKDTLVFISGWIHLAIYHECESDPHSRSRRGGSFSRRWNYSSACSHPLRPCIIRRSTLVYVLSRNISVTWSPA